MAEPGRNELTPVRRRNVPSGGAFEDVYGYHRAVRIGGHVHVSGTTAREPHLDQDAYGQAIAAFAIIAEALNAAGSTLDAVVRTVTYLTDVADAALVARAHREVLGHVRPAATLVAVSALLDPRERVEIEVYAIECP
jgi:enamine deaminase RidA (YjgF/YER057c/UK114 family)